jgi:hypothetical protein
MWRQPVRPVVLLKVLEITALQEDIVERLVQNIIRGCVDESGALIELPGGGLIQLNGSTDWVWWISSSGIFVSL